MCLMRVLCITIQKSSLGVTMTSTLQEHLDRLIERKGESSPLVQMLRNQIAAQESGKTFQDLYLTGSVKKQKQESQKPQ